MFALLYKPKSISSFKFIRDFARQHNITKIGHSGTLDPLASGLLLIATDDDTKLINFFANKTKTYIATIKFGFATDTYDAEGKIIQTSSNRINNETIPHLLNWFKEQTSQYAPIYSAKKIDGKRSYELARQGKSVKQKEQNINVFSVKLHVFDEETQTLVVELCVSNGTYIRSLSHDVGQAFDTCSYMADLERISINNLDKNIIQPQNTFAIINALPLMSIPVLDVQKDVLDILSKGLKVGYNHTNGRYILCCNEHRKNEALGIVKIENNTLIPVKLFGKRLK